MNLELSGDERNLLQKIIRTYLSDLRQTIAATQRGTAGLHAEEDMINRLLTRVSLAD